MRAGSRTPPWIVGLGVLVAVAAVAPLVVKWLNNPPDQRMVDLEVYREGGAAILRGAPLYDVLTQPPQLLPFTYPPFAAVLAVPFTLLPWKAAQWTWTALMYAALTVAVLYAFRDLIRRAGRWAPVAAGALVGATAWLWPASDQMRFGQVGFLLMALSLADCCARSARWPRGVLVGLAMAIKLVPGVFFIWFWITGRREAARTAVLTALAAWGGAFALLPADSRDYWFGAFLQGGDRTGAVGGTTNQALNGMLAHVLPESPWRSLLWLVLAVAVALLGLRLARRATIAGDALGRPGPFGGTDLTRAAAAGPSAYTLLLAGVAITGLLSVLLSPVGWMHHLVWIIAVLGALAGDGRDVRRCLLALGVWLYYLTPLPWRGAALSGREHALPVRIVGRILQDAFGLAALALIVVLGVWLVNRVRTSGDHGERTHGDARVGTLTP